MISRDMPRKIFSVLLIFLLLFSQLLVSFPVFIFAASSPWSQTDWSGGDGQTSWSTTNKFSTSSSVITSTPGQVTLAATSGWYDASWGYRRKITFDNSAQAENLTNFPVLVKLDSTRVDYANTQNNGEDIRFTDSDGSTLLSYEIEKWDETANSYVWVKVPQIDASSNTDYIYMYYGNSGVADAQNASSVWDNNFKSVWHLKETGAGTLGEYKDSTANVNHGQGGAGTASSVPTVTTSGAIGNAQTFDGGDYIANNTVTFPFAAQARSVSAWINIPSYGTQSIFSYGTETTSHRYELGIRTGGYVVAAVNGGAGGTSSTPASGWYKVAITFNGANVMDHKMYINGVEKTLVQQAGSNVAVNTTETTASQIGRNVVANLFLVGSVDEVKVSNSVRSAGWNAAEYKSESDTFNTFGSQEAYSLLSPGTLTSSIFDTEYTSLVSWGNLTYSQTTPANTSISVKVRTSNSSTMTGASDFSSCSAITSGNDISSNSCVTDNHRYVQYQLTLTNTDGLSTPTFEDISLAFTGSSSTPTVDLESPGINSYTNTLRPIFKWKKAVGDSDYDLTIDSPSLGINQNNGDFTLTDIPITGTQTYSTHKYDVFYDNFSDTDTTNDFISLVTKSHSDWGGLENDGKAREES